MNGYSQPLPFSSQDRVGIWLPFSDDDPSFSLSKLSRPWPWGRMHGSSLAIGRLLGTWNPLPSLPTLLSYHHLSLSLSLSDDDGGAAD